MSEAGGTAVPASARRDTNPRKELVREQLLDIAARMFDERGFDRCSLAMIAQEVGLGRSAIYHYFRSKEDILAALIEAEAMEPSVRLIAKPIAKDSSASGLLRTAIVEGVVRRLSSGSHFVRLARLEAQIPESLRTVYDVSRRAIFDYYVRCIEHGICRGEFRRVDSHVAAFSVIGMANWSSRWFRPEGRLSPQEVAEEIAGFALAGLRSDGMQSLVLQEARERSRGLRTEVEALARLLG